MVLLWITYGIIILVKNVYLISILCFLGDVMKKIKLLTTIGVFTFSTLANADAGVFFGLSYAFGGGGPGVSLKVLSSDEEKKAVVGAGVSYYPLATNHFGADVGIGYNFNNAGVMLGYDFLQKGVQVSAGYVNTEDDDNDKPAAAVAPPPPPPPTGPGT